MPEAPSRVRDKLESRVRKMSGEHSVEVRQEALTEIIQIADRYLVALNDFVSSHESDDPPPQELDAGVEVELGDLPDEEE